MYLQKAPNGVYQTRICVPKPLQSFGYPFDIKVSLRTKERSEAIARNFIVANYLRSAFTRLDISHPPKFDLFKTALDQNIDSIRNSFVACSAGYEHPQYKAVELTAENSIDHSSRSHPSTIESGRNQAPERRKTSTRSKGSSFGDYLKLFIKSKRSQGSTELSIYQLEHGIKHCKNFLERKGLDQNTVTSADLLDYVDHLISEKRSAKTNQGYFASVKQYFAWLKAKGILLENPAAGINPKFKNKQHASEQRDRWTEAELLKLFQSPEYAAQTEDFQWVTKLQLFHGFRIGEVCQIYVKDIVWQMRIPCIKVTDLSKDQHLKNVHTVRTIPYTQGCARAFYSSTSHAKPANARPYSTTSH
ncbi:DUF6538 domain-containing protein [Photobacterium phosphoreum]|uniref:DUF6538 domain-containing protein n=1 Tax=Photobacterium phosphoreum TaxID=659 RepID=UPI00215910EE|nr:DUF6538 domain-containing protein [Photobacterium phosphoreum]